MTDEETTIIFKFFDITCKNDTEAEKFIEELDKLCDKYAKDRNSVNFYYDFEEKV